MDSNILYFIVCGDNPQSLINSIWASITLKKIVPSKVILLLTASNQKEIFQPEVAHLLRTLNISPPCQIDSLQFSVGLENNEAAPLTHYIRQQISSSKNSLQITFDLTPVNELELLSFFRWFIYNITKDEAFALNIKHLLYYYLENSDDFRRKWFPEINPKKIIDLDLLEEEM
jgi:hypothetical protein